MYQGKKTGQAINLFRSPHRQDTKGLPFLDSLIMADKKTLFQSNGVKKTNEMSTLLSDLQKPKEYVPTKGSSSYNLCVEYFSQFSFDSEMYT